MSNLRAFAKEIEGLIGSVFEGECLAFNSRVVGGKPVPGSVRVFLYVPLKHDTYLKLIFPAGGEQAIAKLSLWTDRAHTFSRPLPVAGLDRTVLANDVPSDFLGWLFKAREVYEYLPTNKQGGLRGGASE